MRATWEPTLTANEFFAGETKAPRLVDLRPEGMQPGSDDGHTTHVVHQEHHYLTGTQHTWCTKNLTTSMLGYAVSEAPAADPTGRDDQRPPSGTGQAELDKKDAVCVHCCSVEQGCGVG